MAKYNQHVQSLFCIRNENSEVLRRECDRALALVKSIVPNVPVLEVGSTAVRGVIGKQDIDILVRPHADSFSQVRSMLDRRLPRDQFQLSNSIYQGYRVPSKMDVAVQLTVAGGVYDRFIAFLDALRCNPVLVTRYNELKLQWNGRLMDEYRVAKAAFIEEVLASGS